MYSYTLSFSLSSASAKPHAHSSQSQGGKYRNFHNFHFLSVKRETAPVPAFKDRPPTPPSRAQEVLWAKKWSANSSDEEKREDGIVSSDEDGNYKDSILRLVTNRNYMLLLVTYGLNVGVFYAVSTLLNPVIMEHFQVKKSSICEFFVFFSLSRETCVAKRGI